MSLPVISSQKHYYYYTCRVNSGKCKATVWCLFVCVSVCLPSCVYKLTFHDADTDTDTDILADILARIVARMSACRSACHGNNFRKSRVSDVSARILARMSVSVSASWNSSYILRPTHQCAAPDVDSTCFGPSVREPDTCLTGIDCKKM